MNKLSEHDIINIQILYSNNFSENQIVKLTHFSKHTVSKYLKSNIFDEQKKLNIIKSQMKIKDIANNIHQNSVSFKAAKHKAEAQAKERVIKQYKEEVAKQNEIKAKIKARNQQNNIINETKAKPKYKPQVPKNREDLEDNKYEQFARLVEPSDKEDIPKPKGILGKLCQHIKTMHDIHKWEDKY